MFSILSASLSPTYVNQPSQINLTCSVRSDLFDGISTLGIRRAAGCQNKVRSRTSHTYDDQKGKAFIYSFIHTVLARKKSDKEVSQPAQCFCPLEHRTGFHFSLSLESEYVLASHNMI